MAMAHDNSNYTPARRGPITFRVPPGLPERVRCRRLYRVSGAFSDPGDASFEGRDEIAIAITWNPPTPESNAAIANCVPRSRLADGPGIGVHGIVALSDVVQPRNPGKARTLRLLGYGLAVIGLYRVLYHFHIVQFLHELANVSWRWVLLGMIFDVISYAVQGLRWKLLLRLSEGCGSPTRFELCMRDYSRI